MTLPTNYSHTSSNAAAGKLTSKRSLVGVTRLLFRQTLIAAAISAVMKKSRRATANRTKPVWVRDPLQMRETSLSMAVGFAVLVMAAPEASADGNSYVLGRTDNYKLV
jgi:hypothetical protein